MQEQGFKNFRLIRLVVVERDVLAVGLLDHRRDQLGLNPKIARQTIEQLDWLRDRPVSTVFLDGPTS